MIINTNLKKLITSNGDPIQYQLNTGDGFVLLNDFIGKELKIEFTGNHNIIITSLMLFIWQ
jgi:hypothetical protein